MKRVPDFLLNLFFPRRAACMGCGSWLGCEQDDICDDCRETLAKRWVGVRAPDPKLGIDGAAYAYRYAGPAGSLVRRLKYRGVRVLADEMSRDLTRAVKLLQLKDIRAVTAVPMHPKRMQTRGMNHAELLARNVAQRLDLPYAELLMRTRNAPQQARLDTDERTKNLKGGFAVRQDAFDIVKGGRILLIDDVLTTGSTAAACADALRRGGAVRVYFAAFAYGERK